MNKFIFENFTVTHKINKKLKNSYISILNENEVLLKTSSISQKAIHELLESKKIWIHKQLTKAQNNKPLVMNLEDEIILFGSIYSIDSIEATSLRNRLERMKISTKKNVLKSYDFFYKEYAQNYITPKVEHFAKIMGYSYKEIKYKKMKSRWGSCSSTKTLTFNTELIKVTEKLIDYVIVHELAHLKHMNHSKDFHSLVESYLPNSKVYKNELKNIKIATF